MAALEQAVGILDQGRSAPVAPAGARRWLTDRLVSAFVARRSAGPALALLLAGLVGAGGSAALTLGNVEVTSSLGQPFAGIVRIEAAAGEVIIRECFSAGAESAAIPGIPVVADARFQLQVGGGESVLRIASRLPLREPLAQIILRVRCPGLPNITRAFLVMLNPSAIPGAEFERFRDQVPIASSPPVSPRRATVAGDPIVPGSLYTVRPGDSLSAIASRIAGRPPYSVWPLAARIQAANPGAFEAGRADRLVAGATLRMPRLDSIAGSYARTGSSSAPGNDVPAAPNPSATRTGFTRAPSEASQPPVVIGTPLSSFGGEPGVALDYLVLTPALSALSRSRIRQRAAMTPGPGDIDAAESEAMPGPVVLSPESAAGESFRLWWGLLPAALLLMLGAAVFFSRRRAPVVTEGAGETPWEVENAEDPGREMVYDDFEGTFVPKHSIPAPGPGKDPEDDIQTHLMPTMGEEPPTSQDESPDSEASTSLDFPKIETGDIPLAADKPPGVPPRTRPVASGLTAHEVPAMESDGEGWVDLDFEATQILEQDYLAEYAASLKEKVKEQSGAHELHPTHRSGPDESEVLLEASDLMDALDEDPDETRRLETAGETGQGTSELPTIDVDPMIESEEEAVTLTLDDNIFPIDAGQKESEEDDDEQGTAEIKDGRKKS